MTIKSAALAVVLALGASQAMAQPGWYEDGRGGIPARQVSAIVRSTGLTPVTPPARVGPNYVVHAIDRNGETVRVVIDADFGDVVRIHPLGPRMARPGPWNRWAGPRPYRQYGDLSDELGIRQWWNTTPPRPRRSVPVARAPIGPDDAPPPPRPRIDPPVITGAPADPSDAPPPPAGAAAAAPETLPPPPPVNTARTGPDGPPPATALRSGEPKMNRPSASASVPQSAKPRPAVATPAAAPLPKPKPSAEQMAAKPAASTPAEAKPSAQPRVVLPGGPAAKSEKAAEATGAVSPPPAAAPAAVPAPAPAAKTQAAPPTGTTPPLPPMQTLE